MRALPRMKAHILDAGHKLLETRGRGRAAESSTSSDVPDGRRRLKQPSTSADAVVVGRPDARPAAMQRSISARACDGGGGENAARPALRRSGPSTWRAHIRESASPRRFAPLQRARRSRRSCRVSGRPAQHLVEREQRGLDIAVGRHRQPVKYGTWFGGSGLRSSARCANGGASAAARRRPVPRPGTSCSQDRWARGAGRTGRLARRRHGDRGRVEMPGPGTRPAARRSGRS